MEAFDEQVTHMLVLMDAGGVLLNYTVKAMQAVVAGMVSYCSCSALVLVTQLSY